jgi:hypothetical protein
MGAERDGKESALPGLHVSHSTVTSRFLLSSGLFQGLLKIEVSQKASQRAVPIKCIYGIIKGLS